MKYSQRKITELRKMGADLGNRIQIHKQAEIIADEISIEDGVSIGARTRIIAEQIQIGSDVKIGENNTFKSSQVVIGKNSIIGNNNDIHPLEKYSMGDTSYLRNNAHIRGRIVSFGDEVFITNGLRVGGGGRNEPDARLIVGNRCTMHNNFINIAKPVTFGNDVGVSPDSIFITHGFWQSVLEGYSAEFAPITIHDWVILGMRVIVLPGVEIGERTTVGAGAVVSNSLPAKSVAIGVPAKVIKSDYPSLPSKAKQNSIMFDILRSYVNHLVYCGFTLEKLTKKKNSIIIKISNTKNRVIIGFSRSGVIPFEVFNGTDNILLTFNEIKEKPAFTIMNLDSLSIDGPITPLVHDLRDFLRRYGIRFYGYGMFQSLPPKLSIILDEIERRRE